MSSLIMPSAIITASGIIVNNGSFVETEGIDWRTALKR
jgi:hypothetical protein